MGREVMVSIITHENSFITCVEAAFLVSVERDESLSTADTVMLEKHIAACQNCNTAQAQFQLIFSCLDQLFSIESG